MEYKNIIRDKSSLLGNASRVMKLVCHTVNAILSLLDSEPS